MTRCAQLRQLMAHQPEFFLSGERFVPIYPGQWHELPQVDWQRMIWFNDLLTDENRTALLDVGCGGGWAALLLDVGSYTGLDRHPLSNTYADLAVRPFVPHPVTIHQADVSQPWDVLASRSFTSLIACEIIEHLDQGCYERVLREMVRVTTPGAQILISVPVLHLDHVHVSPFHCSELSFSAFGKMFDGLPFTKTVFFQRSDAPYPVPAYPSLYLEGEYSRGGSTTWANWLLIRGGT